MFKEKERSSPDGGKGLNKNLASAGVSFCLIPWRPLGAACTTGGHLALKLGGLALWTPMVASLGPQAMEAMSVCL